MEIWRPSKEAPCIYCAMLGGTTSKMTMRAAQLHVLSSQSLVMSRSRGALFQHLILGLVPHVLWDEARIVLSRRQLQSRRSSFTVYTSVDSKVMVWSSL